MYGQLAKGNIHHEERISNYACSGCAACNRRHGQFCFRHMGADPAANSQILGSHWEAQASGASLGSRLLPLEGWPSWTLHMGEWSMGHSAARRCGMGVAPVAAERQRLCLRCRPMALINEQPTRYPAGQASGLRLSLVERSSTLTREPSRSPWRREILPFANHTASREFLVEALVCAWKSRPGSSFQRGPDRHV